MDSEPLNDKQPGSLTEAAGAKQAAVDSKIQAARERYLARKGKKWRLPFQDSCIVSLKKAMHM
jgi:hypothetical protein